MQITMQHAATKQQEADVPNQSTAVPAQRAKHTIIPMPNDTLPTQNATITKQTIILLSVLALAAMTLYPFIVLRLAIKSNIFHGLSPLKTHDTTATLPTTHITQGNLMTTAYYSSATFSPAATDLLSRFMSGRTSDETPRKATAAISGEKIGGISTKIPVRSLNETPSVSSMNLRVVSSNTSSEVPSKTEPLNLLVRRVVSSLH